MTEYKSKKVVVNRPAVELFNMFTNLEAMAAAVPADKRDMVKIEGDTASVSYGGVSLTVRLVEKVPFSKVVVEDVSAPFHFVATFHFEPAELISQTTFSIDFEADLNFVMKGLIGGRIQEFLDKAADTLALGGIVR